MNSLKKVHIGKIIKKVLDERGISENQLFDFLKITNSEAKYFFSLEKVSIDLLLKISKFLKFDFFRYYSNFLILHYGITTKSKEKRKKVNFEGIRKNVYTQELVDFIVNEVHSGNKTIKSVIEDYNIPKTTVYKWIQKFPKNEEA